MNEKIFLLTKARFSELMKIGRAELSRRLMRDVSQEAAAAHLRENGFKMTARTYQNYEAGATMPGDPDEALAILGEMGIPVDTKRGFVDLLGVRRMMGGEINPEGELGEFFSIEEPTGHRAQAPRQIAGPAAESVEAGMMPEATAHYGIALGAGKEADLLFVDLLVRGRKGRHRINLVRGLGSVNAEDPADGL